MRATKGYVAGVGTTGSLVGAIGCAFALLSAVVAVHGWPLELSGPGTATLEDHGAASGSALPPLGLFPSAMAARRAGGDATGRPDRLRATLAPADADAGPRATAFGPAAAGHAPGGDRTAGGAMAGPSAAGAAGSSAGTATSPGTGSGIGSGAGSGGSPTSQPPADGGSSSPTLGGAVTQVTGGAGAAVTQTGQQLGGAVQGATSQLGGTVGQVSPAVGATVTQSGQVVGGVVSGATSAAGQVVAGAGSTVGGVLGDLGGGG